MKTKTNVIIDHTKIQELLSRSVANVYPSRDFLEKLLKSGKRLTIYMGIDPTGPVLHLGHAITLMKLREFQDLGHKVILLIGDFTAMAGDPDKTEARKILTRKEILANCKNYKKQASRILKFTGSNAAEYKFNSAWLAKLKLQEIMELMSKETVQRMLARDLFDRRIKSGKELLMHEFLYPLMQGYDSVALAVDGEVGGNDQTFNMLTGRDLMKKYLNREKFVITTKLLEDAGGKKMGKTEGNMVTLVDTPKEMFGKVMSWTDPMIEPGFEFLTKLSTAEIKDRVTCMQKGSLNPRDAKAELARMVVAFFHSVDDAKKAEEDFVKQFAKKETPDDAMTIAAPRGDVLIADVISDHKLAASKSEARRLIEQGGVKVNQTKVTDWKKVVRLQSGDIIQVGKRKFIKIV
jgi:tyrosyl-tRNA synthetase